VLEARVEMWFQSQLKHDRVVVAVDVGIHTVKPLEHLTDQSWESLWEWYTWSTSLVMVYVVVNESELTDLARKLLLVINVGLTPHHQVLNVLRRGHLCWFLEVL
jgi:hypothetical protein